MGFMTSPTSPEVDMGRLYTLRKGNLQQAYKDPVQISNGLAWSPDNTVLYWIDSGPKAIYTYNYDATTGTIGTIQCLESVSYSLVANQLHVSMSSYRKG